MIDYYEVLRVHPNADLEDIKDAYKRLAHKLHPDMGGDTKKFQELHEAYEVLSHSSKRATYDHERNTNGKIVAEYKDRNLTRGEKIFIVILFVIILLRLLW